jgi:small subunit ribosomal protein S1
MVILKGDCDLAKDDIMSRLRVGERISGNVIGREPFGVFVDVGNDVQGFVDAVEVSDRFIKGVEDYPQIGDRVEATILQVDPKSRRIRLTLRHVEFPDANTGVLE